MKTVSCVIPAYNESQRIGNVMEVVAGHPLISEVLVIDDGSKDVEETAKIVAKYPEIRFIRHEINQGKSKALYTGITNAQGEYLFFLDSDLIGLTKENITDLINPIMTEKAGISISMRKNSPWIDRKIGIDFISGERVFHKSMLDGYLEEIPKLSRFGVETFLNTIIIKKEWPIAVVYWPNVISPYPVTKRGLLSGIQVQAGMIIDICSIIPFYMIPHMFYKMRTLMIQQEK